MTQVPPPRLVVIVISLAVVGGMIYLGSRENYVGTICCALVLLSILGADVGALMRAWRGVPEPTPPAIPPPVPPTLPTLPSPPSDPPAEAP